MERHFFFFFPELCRGWESVYSFISGEALSLKILPIIAVIKVNKQLIDSSCFQFPPLIFGGLDGSNVTLPGKCSQTVYLHWFPWYQNRPQKNDQEKEIITEV